LLEDIRELDNTFILSDRWGDEARGVENNKILQYIKNVSEFNKFLVIGGGSDETKFDTGDNSSIEIAKYFDAEDKDLFASISGLEKNKKVQKRR
jgi:hypothetical protein